MMCQNFAHSTLACSGTRTASKQSMHSLIPSSSVSLWSTPSRSKHNEQKKSCSRNDEITRASSLGELSRLNSGVSSLSTPRESTSTTDTNRTAPSAFLSRVIFALLSTHLLGLIEMTQNILQQHAQRFPSLMKLQFIRVLVGHEEDAVVDFSTSMEGHISLLSKGLHRINETFNYGSHRSEISDSDVLSPARVTFRSPSHEHSHDEWGHFADFDDEAS